MLLLALKHSRSPDVLNVLPQIIRLSEKIPNGDYDYLKVVLIYLASVINKGLTVQFWKIVAKEHSGGEVYMETIADLLREEERLKREKIERKLHKEIEQKSIVYKQKIEQKERVIEQKDTVIKQISIENKERLYHIIQRMLKKGMSWKTIREITGFSNEEIEQIIDNIKRDNNNKEV